MNVGGVSNLGGPHAASVVRGLTSAGKIHETASQLADDTSTVTGCLDSDTRVQMTQDLQQLKTGLWARGVSTGQMTTAMMTAGVLLGGPAGVEVSTLAGNLYTTVRSKEKMDSLAQQVEHFGDRQKGDPPNADGVYLSLNNQVTQALVADGVTSKNVPVALFLGGALLNADSQQKT